MIRAVLYLRSSKDRADVSIDAQRRALHELAAARGFAVVDEFADAVESGKDDDRPGFQRLIAALRAPGRTWDHVLALDTARVARRRALAIIFEEHECKRRGVRVIYRSLPDSDPITEMLLKSILQAMDEWHSLTSKVKGIAGMTENVRQGWRAGGRAPRGYALEAVATGAMRDGAPVTKTRLVPGPDAAVMRGYLKARARGVQRARAARESGLDAPANSLIDIDRNALTYAGHTVWNRHAERDGSGYVGGSKVRPRSEWIIQRDTHDALISEAEAEAILSMVDAGARRSAKPGARVYILSGLLVSPDGVAWHGDSGFYRLTKGGTKIAAGAVEAAVVSKVVDELQSDAMVDAVADHYRRMASPSRDTGKEAAALKRKIADMDRRAARLAQLLSETSAPEALLRQIEGIESERVAAAESLASLEADASMAQSLRAVSKGDVRRMLAGLAGGLTEGTRELLRDALRQIVERVDLDPATFEATVICRLSPSQKGGSSWRPHGDSCLTPDFTRAIPVLVRHNRRRLAA